MKTCAKCGKKFKLKYTSNNSGYRSVSTARKYCYDCSPFNSHNTNNNEYYNTKTVAMRMCYNCKQLLPENKFYKKTNSGYCKECFYIIQNEYRKNVKKRMVEYKGGKCLKCGYNKCINALEFHHRDPLIKDHAISHSRSFDLIKQELDKCDLLCANCHREAHS